MAKNRRNKELATGSANSRNYEICVAKNRIKVHLLIEVAAVTVVISVVLACHLVLVLGLR